MSVLFAYMADGEEGEDQSFKMFCHRGGRIFSTCFLCVCGGGGGQVQ